MDVKIIQKYKDKSYDQLHATAKIWFNKFIRLRDTDDNGIGFCISSGRPVRYGTKYCHAGHYFSGSKYRILEFNEDNVHVQSLSDNYFGHSEGASYTINLSKKIGFDRMDELQRLSLVSKRTTYVQDRFLMIEIIEKYKVKVKDLAKEKMFKVN